MLELLELTAESMGLSFAFGGLDDLNSYADTIPEGETKKTLFFSCYQPKGLTVSQGGYLRTSPKLEIYILSPSNLTDEPRKRYQQILSCEEIAKRVYMKIVDIYSVENGQLTAIITATDNPLDGASITGTLLTNPESLC